MTAIPDSFDEFCLVSLLPDSGSESQFAAYTEDITAMDWGEKDIEGRPNIAGGRHVRKVPMTDESMTLKVFPISAKTTGSGGIQNMHPNGLTADSIDDYDPVTVGNSNFRMKHRVVMLWSTALPTQTVASTIPAAGNPSYRIQVINAYVTKYTPSFDDKTKSAELGLKWAPFNRSGTENKREESVGTTASLVAATTSATEWA